MEPPTPLRNADFRSLLASTPRPILKPTATPSHPSSTASTPSHPPPPKSTKRLEHYQRYLAKQSARQQHKPPDGDDTPGPSRSRHGYRDRARERRFDDNPDYEQSSAASTASLSEEASKFLGGDEEHTHLVKGLDFALVRRKREEEERRQQEKLDQLLAQEHTASPPSSSSSLLTPSSASKAPEFCSTLARAVYDLVVPPPITPSDRFLPGRLSYSLPLPPPSPFALLPLALAAPAPRSTALLSQLNQLPVSVLVAKDDLVAEGDRVSGFVPPSVLRQVRTTMEKKRERRRRKKASGHSLTAAEREEGKEGSADEGEGEELRQAEQPSLTVEERRKQLMEVDDDDIFFGGGTPAAASPTDQGLTAPSPPLLPSAAVFKPAAPTSKYFQTPSALPVTVPPPAMEDSTSAAPSAHAASSPSPPLSHLSPPLARSAAASSSSLSTLHDEYDELYPDAAISFSGAYAGDEDSDDEANAAKDKKREKEEKMQAKRGGGGGGRGGGRRHRGPGMVDQVEMKREEKRREAKIDSQLAGVTELLKKDAGKLRLHEFEREGAALEAAKKLKIG